jgi:hypothetical protein
MEGRDPQRSSRADVRGPETNALAFSLDLPEPAFGEVVQAADGTSYVGLQEGGVLAVNSSGGIRWRFTPPVAGPSPTPAVGPDGTIYVRATPVRDRRSIAAVSSTEAGDQWRATPP